MTPAQQTRRSGCAGASDGCPQADDDGRPLVLSTRSIGRCYPAIQVSKIAFPRRAPSPARTTPELRFATTLFLRCTHMTTPAPTRLRHVPHLERFVPLRCVLEAGPGRHGRHRHAPSPRQAAAGLGVRAHPLAPLPAHLRVPVVVDLRAAPGRGAGLAQAALEGAPARLGPASTTREEGAVGRIGCGHSCSIKQTIQAVKHMLSREKQGGMSES